MGPQAAKQARAPGRNTRRSSASARWASLKNITPKRQVARSKIWSANGNWCASASLIVMFKGLLFPGALGSNEEQFRTLIHRCHRTLGTNALRQTDARFAGAAGQIENEHVRERTRVFNES